MKNGSRTPERQSGRVEWPEGRRLGGRRPDLTWLDGAVAWRGRKRNGGHTVLAVIAGNLSWRLDWGVNGICITS